MHNLDNLDKYVLYLLQYDVGVDENEEDGEGKRGEGCAQLNK